MSQALDLIQSMSFFSITGTSGNKEQQLKLPSLPKNEGQFTLWRIKVESTIHGAGLMDYITHEKTKLYSRALDRLNNYRREIKTKMKKRYTSMNYRSNKRKLLTIDASRSTLRWLKH